MKQEYREAFTEVNVIIQLMPEELVNKVPSRFRVMLEEEKDKNYHPDIKEPLEEQKLKEETIIILGLICRDFLCSPEERKELQEKDAKELQEVQMAMEEEMREKYNPDDIFKNRRKNNSEEQSHTENTSMIVVKEEKWYQKIFQIIKKLFKRQG